VRGLLPVAPPSGVLALFVAALLAVGLAACSPGPEPTDDTAAQEGDSTALPALADLASGWSTLRPGGETTCALGTEYSFFVRPSPARESASSNRGVTSDRLVIYLQGGGACWTGDNCDPESSPTYSRDVDETDNPAGRPVGIFDFDNPANPLAADSFVMIPYCTGDVHLGDLVTTYPVEPEEGESYDVAIQHRGYVNAMAAIEWAFANFESPAEILVTGSSAGSIPAPFYGQIVAEHYPQARVTVLGDGAGSYRRDSPDQVDPTVIWDTLTVLQRQPGYEEFTAGELGYHDLYIVAGRRHPEMRLFEYDAAHDAVQGFFLQLSGAASDDPAPLIDTNQADIRAAIPNFKAFIAGGREHTILWQPAFYQYEVEGRLFRDWFADLVDGQEVAGIACEDCDRADLRFTDDDRRIVARAAARLTAAPAWESQDDGACPGVDEVAPSGLPADDEPPLSLRCVVEQATAEVLGDPSAWSAAQLAIEDEIVARVPETDLRSPLRDFNNRPSTTLVEIRALLVAVGERIGGR